MIAYLFYTKASSSQSQAETYAAELEKNQVETKLIDADSVDGVRFAELYDLTARPALALARSDGSLADRWQGELPLVSEVSYMAHQ